MNLLSVLYINLLLAPWVGRTVPAGPKAVGLCDPQTQLGRLMLPQVRLGDCPQLMISCAFFEGCRDPGAIRLISCALLQGCRGSGTVCSGGSRPRDLQRDLLKRLGR